MTSDSMRRTREPAANAGLAQQRDLAAHDLRQQLGDGEAQPHARHSRCPALVDALERLEHALLVRAPDADPRVGDGDLGDGAAPAEAQADAAGPRELHGVGQQVDQDLPEPPLVRIDHRWRAGRQVEHETQALRLRLQPEHVGDLPEELRQAHLVPVQLDPPGLDFRDVEQPLDQTGQVLAAAPDHANAFAPRFGDGGVVLQQLRVAEDRVQRRAQLMADADDEAAFRQVGGLGDLLGLLQLRVGAAVGADLAGQQ